MEEMNTVDTEVTATEVASDPQPAKKGGAVHEFFRKRIVSLKRRPHMIAMVVYFLSIIVYTLRLTLISDTTAYIQLNPMGLCEFIAVLFSLLGFAVMINVYPKRKKTNYVMLGLFVAIVCVVIACDIIYFTKLNEGIASHYETFTTESDYTKFNTTYSYLFEVKNILIAHITIIAIAAVLFALSPVIGKLLKKINTSVELDLSENIAAIDTEGDD